MLCSSCQKIFLGERSLNHPTTLLSHNDSELKGHPVDEKEPQYTHHVSNFEFIRAAEAGCQLCLMLLCQLSTEDQDALARPLEEVDASLFTENYPTIYSIHGGYGFGRGREGFLQQHAWYLRVQCMCPTSVAGKVREINCQVDFITAAEQAPLVNPQIALHGTVGKGDLVISLVHHWIQICNRTHKKCKHRSALRRARPAFSRIIDVGNEQKIPRLLHVKDVPANTLYMTLSHCWGGKRPLQLHSGNYDELKKGITWTTLPKTFADAITFTRKLGVKLLWIDSLCIMQDNKKDWEQQSKVMGDIYFGSFLNIAATGAADSNGGMFHKRNGLSIRPLRVFVPNMSRLLESFKTEEYGLKYYDATVDIMWQREVEQASLCGRAWIVQERLLPRRCLHFGRRQLYWECPTISACETFPYGLITSMNDTLAFKAYDPLQPDLATTLGAFENGLHQDPPSFLSIWGRIVETYTSASLTRDTDKLVAVAGMAKKMAGATGLKYLAGFWNCDTPNQLLWSTLAPTERPIEACAPSWSWASVNSPVHWHFDILERVRIAVQNMQPSDKVSQFSQYETGQLRLRGDLVPGTLHKDAGGSFRLTLRGSLDVKVMLDAIEDNLGPVVCVVICYSVERDSATKLILEHRGLILRGAGKKGVLRRLGLFSLRQKVEYVCNLDRNIRLLDYKNFPSSMHPLEELDEKNYLSYIDVVDGGGLQEEINEHSFYYNLTLAQMSSMKHSEDANQYQDFRYDQSKRQKAGEEKSDFDHMDSDVETQLGMQGEVEEEFENDVNRELHHEMTDNEDEDMSGVEEVDYHVNPSGGRPMVRILFHLRKEAADEERAKESGPRSFGGFIFDII